MFGQLSRPKNPVFSFDNTKGIRAMSMDSVKPTTNFFRKRVMTN